MLAAAREALSVRPSLGAAVGNNITEVERTWTEKKVGKGGRPQQHFRRGESA